jgi:hypothetical protein
VIAVMRDMCTPTCRPIDRPMIGNNKCKCWRSEMSNWEDRVEKEWAQWIELVAGLSALSVLVFSLLAGWDGKSP